MVGVVVLLYLVSGLMLTRTAPDEIRWILWILLATLIFPLLLVGIWLRRRLWGHPPAKGRFPGFAQRGTRLKGYVVAAIVTAISAAEQARHGMTVRRFSAKTADIFIWNFAAFAVLIATVEILEWRRKRLS